MATFDVKVQCVLKLITEFTYSTKKIHDMAKCPSRQCEVGSFSDELYEYIYCRRWSPRLLKSVFVNLCKKYPDGFEHCYNAARNKNFVMLYLLVK